ncbi:MAG TPA: PadR family transcriptional regulator [Gaiellaceae bacterium]|nr:PadR family transcriptional regulator [Gaiellaceae bacterium]
MTTIALDTLRLATTEAGVLGLLALDGERSGYDLSKQAEQSVGHVWAPTKSHLYAVLRRLSAQGLVSARQVAQERRPDKQLYSLTEAGHASLQAWLDAVPRGDQSGLVLRLFLGGLASAESHRRTLEAFRDDMLAQLEVYAEIDARNSRRGHDLFHGAVLDLGIARAEAALAWAEARLAEPA